MKDLEYCEKYGFDYIDIQSECLQPDLDAGNCTLEEIAEWLRSHKLKVWSYSALENFNMCPNQVEREWAFARLKEIIRRCLILDCKMIVLCPRRDLETDPTLPEIKADTVATLREMVKLVEPHGIKLAMEFCGFPGMTVNRFEVAYDIVTEVNHPLVGITFDQAHFHNMASDWNDLEKADGSKIFTWHLCDSEDVPRGGSVSVIRHRILPNDPRGCLDNARYARTLKAIGYEGACSVEIFRPEYYELSQEENIRKTAECAKEHILNYWC